jgi:hypothetical protein
MVPRHLSYLKEERMKLLIATALVICEKTHEQEKYFSSVGRERKIMYVFRYLIHRIRTNMDARGRKIGTLSGL